VESLYVSGYCQLVVRLNTLVPAGLILGLSSHVFAQEWSEFVSRNDFFTLNFPGEPTVTSTTYATEYGAMLPAHLYSKAGGASSYSITVVDYTNAEAIHTERAKTCPPDAHTGCTGAASTGVGSWKVDVRGAPEYAAWQFMQRDSKVTFFGWNFVDLVEGRQLQLTNADGSRTFVGIYMHESRLYILEAKVPRGLPEPGLFQQSLGFIDKDGKGIRYESVYSNGFPAPPRVR
jgi:hypothetical protein